MLHVLFPPLVSVLSCAFLTSPRQVVVKRGDGSHFMRDDIIVLTAPSFNPTPLTFSLPPPPRVGLMDFGENDRSSVKSLD